MDKPIALSASGHRDGPKRALVLAGGGMRLAYQAGVLHALAEQGLDFAHADGTSGGIFNLGMLFSGLSPSEMCRRWRSLNVKDFVSYLPWERYLNPFKLMGFGDADGLIKKVFPHLGISVASINAAQGMEGTFNVCNFSRKTNEAINHRQVTLDHLVAGVSLPIFMPPVKIGDDWYTDSVWIKDANLWDTVKAGADEIWLVWAIGNSATYRAGSFYQYVHMIEMSANGKLFEEFDRINDLNARIERGDSPFGQSRPIRLHVITPEFPLPLDPDYYFNRINAASLIDMGYADARRYLGQASDLGVPLHPDATHMREAAIHLTMRLRWAGELKGEFGDGGIAVHVTLDVHDALHRGRSAYELPAVSHLVLADGKDIVPAAYTRIVFETDPARAQPASCRCEIGFTYQGRQYSLTAEKCEATQGRKTHGLRFRLYADGESDSCGEGELRRPRSRWRDWFRIHVIHAPGAWQRIQAKWSLWRLFA
jgi:predicted acylesterase/phospholipase RssA